MLTQEQTRFQPRMWRLDELRPGQLPLPTRDDLISMKAVAISERFLDEKRLQDLEDIKVLLGMFPGPLLFPGSAQAEANKAFVKQFVPLLSEFGDWPKKKWLHELGL